MRLLSAQVQDYKLIRDTGEFRVGDLTCLVGKNESGKTAVLQALQRLKPDDPAHADFDPEIEYPRHELFDYKARHADNPAVVVTTRWEVDEAFVNWVEDVVGQGVLTGREVTVSRGYANRNYWSVSCDEPKAVRNLVADSGLDQVDIKKLDGVTKLAELVPQVEGLEASARQETFLERLRNLLSDDKTLSRILMRRLQDDLPTFVYYANYYTLPGEVALDQLVAIEAAGQLSFKEKIFKALLALVGSSPTEINEAQRYEALKADLEAIGLRLTKEIFEYWSQNRDLEVEFTFDMARPGDPPPFNSGFIFRTRIKNRRHGVSVSFDERSTGFVWFFSFLVWFSQMQRLHGEKLVILLDEPGLSLHGTAQADLLRYINEKLVPRYQVVYSTHSPFMVDSQNLLSVRTVEDVVDESGAVLGTKVGDEVLSTDAETLFPLRAALGYDITQTLFIGEHSLLVEGPSDLLYLNWASSEMKDRGRTSLDRRWTITPCGGIRKVGSFLSLFGGHKLHVAVFADFTQGDKGAVRTLRESDLLRDGHVLSAEMFCSDQAEADVEDLLGRRLYVELVNKAFDLPVAHRLKASSIQGAPERVVKEVEEHFRTVPAESCEYEHFTPSEYLVEHRGEVASFPGVDVALDRFEQLFETLNGFLA